MTATDQKSGAEEVLFDLTDLYSGSEDPKFERDLAETLTAAEGFRKKYYGKVAELSAADLADMVAEIERISSIASRAGIFAYLRFSTDTFDPARGALVQRIQEHAAKLQTDLLFAELEWLAVDDEKAKKLLQDPLLKRYRHWLASQRRFKPYVLSEAEEKILTEKSVTGRSSWSRLFTELMASLRVTIDGEELPFEAAASQLLLPDREQRRKAAEGITAALNQGLRTRSFILNTLLLDKSVEDRLRGYPSWISERNLSNEASDESVQALVEAVVSRYDIPQRYYALKAKLLDVDRLAYYDRMAPISSDSVFVGWDEAREIVQKAYDSFSATAGDVIRRFFESGWIDAAPLPNKTPGAFCMTNVPDVHPYVLMSYTANKDSVLTLAHELGHGVHGFLAQDLGLFNASTPLTLAETASVFGETITFGKLLEQESEPRKRLDLIAHRLEDAIATVFRQIAMNRFEDAVHTKRRSGGELSVESISDVWIETQRTMLGDAVDLADDYRIWWSYIPHFIGSPGYVYAYAFGYLFSLAIYRKYEKDGDSMVDPYLNLLRAGGSDSPENLASIVGLDLADPGFWAGGLETVDSILAEAEALAKTISDES